MVKDLRTALLTGIKALLRPAVVFAVRRSFRIQDLTEALKEVFLDVAEDELQRDGAQVNVSRLSALTGLHRRDVMRLWRDEHEPKRGTDLVTRIVGQWQADKRFLTANGRPKTLQLEGRRGAFADLVSSVSSDLNPYTVLFELERAGTVERTERGIRLVRRSYQPRGDLEEGMGLLQEDGTSLMHAVTQNLLDSPALENLHIKTVYDNIPQDDEEEIRRWFLRNGVAIHENARSFLGAKDRDINPKAADSGNGRLKATLVTFSFTERVEE